MIGEAKIKNILIETDNQFNIFDSKIVTIVGLSGSGKTSFMKNLYDFYDGLKYEMLYENTETLECFSNSRRKCSEFEYSNKNVILYDSFGINNKSKKFLLNMIKNKSHINETHKIFLSAPLYTSGLSFNENPLNISGGAEILYMSDLVLKIQKFDYYYKISVLKNRNNNIKSTTNTLVPFFFNLANEYSNIPMYPNKSLNQHLSKYLKMDSSIIPFDNFKDIFNIIHEKVHIATAIT
jgi:ABC-type dipeptide/oligopeptide/nickel transport system ATPase component